MNDDTITTEKMNQFVEDNRPFLSGVWEWVMSKTDVHDIENIDLFTAWVTEALQLSSRTIRADIHALKKGQIH